MFSHHPNGNGHASSFDDFYDASAELADLGQARYDNDTAAAGDRDTALNSYRPVFVKEGRAPRGLEAEAFGWRTFQHTTDERDEKEDLKSDLHEGQLHRQNRAARDMEDMQARMGHMGLHPGMNGGARRGGGRMGRGGHGPGPMPMSGRGGSRGDRGGGMGGPRDDRAGSRGGARGDHRGGRGGPKGVRGGGLGDLWGDHGGGRGSSRGDRGGGRGGRGRRGGAGGPQNGFHSDEGLCAGRKSNGPPSAKGVAKELDANMFWNGPIN